jgi:hypothetical protein
MALLVDDSVKDAFRIGVPVGVDGLRQDGLRSLTSDDRNVRANRILTESGLRSDDGDGRGRRREILLLRSDDLIASMNDSLDLDRFDK